MLWCPLYVLVALYLSMTLLPMVVMHSYQWVVKGAMVAMYAKERGYNCNHFWQSDFVVRFARLGHIHKELPRTHSTHRQYFICMVVVSVTHAEGACKATAGQAFPVPYIVYIAPHWPLYPPIALQCYLTHWLTMITIATNEPLYLTMSHQACYNDNYIGFQRTALFSQCLFVIPLPSTTPQPW